MSGSSFIDDLDEVVAEVVGPQAASTDAGGVFPRAGVTALGERGLLGLMSSTDVGGMGLGLAEAAQVVRRLAAQLRRARPWWCACTTRAVAVIEAHGPDDVRRAIAAGAAPVDAGVLRDRVAQPVLGPARHGPASTATTWCSTPQELGDLGRRGRLVRVDEPADVGRRRARRCGWCRPTPPG